MQRGLAIRSRLAAAAAVSRAAPLVTKPGARFNFPGNKSSAESPMTDGASQERREHDLTMRVFSISAAMVGVCAIIAYALI